MTTERTLKQAKDDLRSKLFDGATCECCGRHTQLYVRQITSSMALGLIKLFTEGKVHENGNGYIHIERFFKDLIGVPASIRADIPKLRFWGLIQPEGKENEDGNPNSGLYKITEQGKLFVEGKILVPSHINVYNNKMYGFNVNAKDINIKQALKNKFNYNLLMGREVAT